MLFKTSMNITPRKVNAFMFFKLPLAWIGGVRVREMNATSCVVKIRHRWINQNPFRSMFWAAQGMAAEMKKIADSGKKVSMLVTDQRGNFTKKATGLIRFECHDGTLIEAAIQKSAETGEGQVITMKSTGYNKEGISVSNFEFEWSLKVK